MKENTYDIIVKDFDNKNPMKQMLIIKKLMDENIICSKNVYDLLSLIFGSTLKNHFKKVLLYCLDNDIELDFVKIYTMIQNNYESNYYANIINSFYSVIYSLGTCDIIKILYDLMICNRTDQWGFKIIYKMFHKFSKSYENIKIYIEKIIDILIINIDYAEIDLFDNTHKLKLLMKDYPNIFNNLCNEKKRRMFKHMAKYRTGINILSCIMFRIDFSGLMYLNVEFVDSFQCITKDVYLKYFEYFNQDSNLYITTIRINNEYRLMQRHSEFMVYFKSTSIEKFFERYGEYTKIKGLVCWNKNKFFNSFLKIFRLEIIGRKGIKNHIEINGNDSDRSNIMWILSYIVDIMNRKKDLPLSKIELLNYLENNIKYFIMYCRMIYIYNLRKHIGTKRIREMGRCVYIEYDNKYDEKNIFNKYHSDVMIAKNIRDIFIRIINETRNKIIFKGYGNMHYLQSNLEFEKMNGNIDDEDLQHIKKIQNDYFYVSNNNEYLGMKKYYQKYNEHFFGEYYYENGELIIC